LRLLEQAAWSKDASIDSVATRLHMTSRTLRRKLRAEDSGFQHVKDSLRRDQAINFLVTSRYPIAEVGRRVGFAEPAAFTRAFKQWTGVSPNRYRQELQLQGPSPNVFMSKGGKYVYKNF
ncbi:MAG: helix-turn-helix transcriptional regulator, partial [Proteobacteria bacterium]|nr:helix-turn-helix transcriptional regulator [Pseudomonadota bacterium]